MRTQISHLTTVSKKACSIFWTLVSGFITLKEPACSISCTSVSETVIIWIPVSAKYCAPVLKTISIWKQASKTYFPPVPDNFEIWSVASKNYSMSVLKNILFWKPASRIIWTPVSTPWQAKSRVRPYISAWVENRRPNEFLLAFSRISEIFSVLSHLFPLRSMTLINVSTMDTSHQS